VLEWCRAAALEPFDRRTHKGFLRNLVVREARRTGQLQVRLITTEGRIDGESLAAAVDVESLLWTRTDAAGETTAGGETELLAGSVSIEERLGELSLRVSAEAFFQTNTEMAERLYAIAAEGCDLHGWERVFDLYCGTGTIGLSLARHAGHVYGLEIVEEAVADAIANAQRNEITNASFYAGDVRLAMRELLERAGRPDLVVLDPPRSGLSAKIVRRVIESAPKRIVYVSCNPTTLAPNAAQLVEAGWRLERVSGVDMFPQTPHIECVAVLVR
jgi:23S rRNA (uracil1939-C5)-methyltransferase